MVDKSLGNVSIVQGWLLDPRWVSPLEGPCTVLSKLQIVNAMSLRDLCGIFGARVLDSQAATTHGRSLLDMSWVRSGQEDRQLVVDLRARSLSRICDRWWRALASDQHLRFCPRCIANGFQSVLCQLDGLNHCPVHGDRIIDSCPHCSAPTPRYAITHEAFEQPMTCPSCGRSYARCWDRAVGIGQWSEPEGIDAYRTMAHWLRSIDRIDCSWPDQAAWMVDFADEAFEHNKRASVLGLLCRLHAGPSACEVPDLDVRSFDLPAAVLNDDVAGGRGPGDRVRRQIYKAIRRHYRAAIRAARRNIWLVRDELVYDTAHTVLMPTSCRVSAGIHAFLCWRSRFERPLLHTDVWAPREAPLWLRLELLHWPMNWNVSDRAWGHFAQLCLMHELDAAKDLHAQLVGIDLYRAGDLPAWMEVVRNAFHRFGPERQSWPAALTCLVLEAAHGTPARRFVLVSAPRRGQRSQIASGGGRDDSK